MKLIRLICLVLMGCGVHSSAFADGVFPVVVKHALGSTVIEKSPQRIITIGWSGEDSVLALGVTPIAMPRYTTFPSGIFPWNEAKLSDTPTLLNSGMDYEAIAALKPDLILGVYSGLNALSYQRLSSIAPTVAYRSGPWRADWREQTTIIGEALGKQDEAEKLVESADDYLVALGKSYPELAGKTFTFGTFFPGSGNLVVYLPSDPRVAALRLMGLELSPGVKALGKQYPDEFSTGVSLENLDNIDADILILWFGDTARTSLETQPLFQALGAVQRGSYVALEDPVELWATSALSVSSIPYGFQRFATRLANAARITED
ncbi:iron-siderophore ABC transporter substrate-binding protein [Ochrobactrum sp. S46]|nr:iron-siderophore ABC transporter substrate-binding protein [Ochrobactrum sp. S45]MBK0044896.1 iron-siderophore ABC transporter substrate-binding protein [Ochrobactrum sp. S46]